LVVDTGRVIGLAHVRVIVEWNPESAHVLYVHAREQRHDVGLEADGHGRYLLYVVLRHRPPSISRERSLTIEKSNHTSSSTVTQGALADRRDP
jgi:hypothetical protein